MQAFVVGHDTEEVKAWFKAFGKQVPFAGSIAINRTGEDILAEARTAMKSRFTIRNYGGREFLPDAKLVGSRRATKARLYAFVGVGNPAAGPKTLQGRMHNIYSRQEYSGGVAQAGRNDFAIPADRVDNPGYQPPRKVYPTSLGLASRRSISGTWIDATNKVKRRKDGYFILPRVNGSSKGYGIYHRDAGARGPGSRGDISAVWFLRPSIRRKPRPFFHATAQRVADLRWSVNMLGALEAAVRTAK
jgi:hypothetical protein